MLTAQEQQDILRQARAMASASALYGARLESAKRNAISVARLRAPVRKAEDKLAELLKEVG